jgi:hypothetical protein
MVLPSLLTPCIDDFVTRAGATLDRAADRAAADMEAQLRALPSQQTRQTLSAALRELSRQRGAWRLEFPEALRQAVKNPPPPRPTAMVSPSSLSLTLVDDEEMEQSIEVSRIAQQLRNAADQPLAELDALMSSALGLEGIQPEENPLRPDVFARALRGVLAGSAQQPEWTGLWLKYLSPAIGEDLAHAYQHAVKLLRQARVEARGYRVLTAPSPLDGRAVSKPASLEPARASSHAELREGTPSQPAALWRNVSGFAEFLSQALRGPAFSEFLARGSAHAKQALAPAWFARVDNELAALEARSDEAPLSPEFTHRYAHLPAVERPVREVGTDMPLDRQAWGELGTPRRRSLVRTQLKKQARNVGQAMGIEVVRQLVDQVAKDRRLLAPVRESFVALEPSLSRLALQAPQFFGEESHPARKLVERVAERSFKYNDEFSPPFRAFFEDVKARFKEIDAVNPIRDEEPFARALGDLEAKWAQEDSTEEAEKQRVLKAMKFAEARQAEAGEVSWGLSQRSDLEGVPALVQDFLYNRWALVMAHARLRSNGKEIDPGGFGAVVSDLLWTVKRDLVLRDPPHAFELIPRVLMKLRAGLELLGDTPSEDDNFFRALEKLHRPVLKLRAKHRKQALDLPSQFPEFAEADPTKAITPAKSDEVYLAASEQRNFGYRDTEVWRRPSEETRPVVPDDSPAAQTTVALLEVGSWVDLYSRQDWLRAQLTWASANKQLYLFTSHGGLAHTMTRRSLLRLVADKMLRTVEGHAVVQHAIEQIARPERMAA